MEQKRTILAMYSGGLDSLGMVYKLLTDPVYRDYALHIHHVHNKNKEKRHYAEAITVDMALKELKALGFTFTYSESEIGVPSYGRYFLFDTDSLNFFAGYIASVNPDIEKVAVGMNANDANHSLEDRRIRAAKILTAFTDAEKIFPVMDMSKREILDSLPLSLKKMFWSCRVPVYSEKTVTPCGKCDTCKTLKEQGIGHLILKYSKD
jgi:7-cyano-7-deazaguanine synthase in queuosine biosynthesis